MCVCVCVCAVGEEAAIIQWTVSHTLAHLFNDAPLSWQWIAVLEVDGIRPVGHRTSFSSGLRPGSPAGHSARATVPPSPSPSEQPTNKQTSTHT